MGSIPFSSPKAGGNPIETWYAEGMDFCWNTIAIGSNFPTPPSSLYPISDMRHTGYAYPNRLDPRVWIQLVMTTEGLESTQSRME